MGAVGEPQQRGGRVLFRLEVKEHFGATNSPEQPVPSRGGFLLGGDAHEAFEFIGELIVVATQNSSLPYGWKVPVQSSKMPSTS